MLEPPPRRRPATNLELKVARGLPFDLIELDKVICGPMLKALSDGSKYDLTDEEKNDLCRDVMVELTEQPSRYDSVRSALPTYAKMRVRTHAIDYLRDRAVARRQQVLFVQHSGVVLERGEAQSSLESEEYRTRVSKLSVRVRAIIAELPREQLLAAQAFEKYGQHRYAKRLAEELGISPNTVAQWWRRAKAKICVQIGTDWEVVD